MRPQGQLPAAEWERARRDPGGGVSEDSTLRRSVRRHGGAVWTAAGRASAYREALEQLPLASVEEAARGLLAPEQRFTLLVGDWAVLEPQLTSGSGEPVLIQTPSWRPAEPLHPPAPEEPR